MRNVRITVFHGLKVSLQLEIIVKQSGKKPQFRLPISKYRYFFILVLMAILKQQPYISIKLHQKYLPQVILKSFAI